MEVAGGNRKKPHAVCAPGPVQSHIGAMMKLAKLLHHRGFFITFVNTDFNHHRLLNARGPDRFPDLPDFRFVSIPDGIPLSNADATQDINAIGRSLRVHLPAPFFDLVSGLRHPSNPSIPPVSCLVSDGFMIFSASPAAERLGIPLVNLWTISACAFMGFRQYRNLLETRIDWIPGMGDMRLRDLPSFMRTTDPNDVLFNLSMDVAERANAATANILHTFEALEPEVLDAISSPVPNVFAIGPLHLLLDHIPEGERPLEDVDINLWKEHAECLEWLDSRKPHTVMYVNFGSVAFLTGEQLVELASGLASSNQAFLWVLRPDLVNGEAVTLPPGFKEETQGRGMLSGWCPQVKVLRHPAVGGFLTHCGWNSVLESLAAGVPMLCWPCLGDQQTNCRFVCKEWGAGLEMEGEVRREQVEAAVREMIQGKEGSAMRRGAARWKELAAEAVSPGGSSSINLEALIREILEPKTRDFPPA